MEKKVSWRSVHGNTSSSLSRSVNRKQIPKERPAFKVSWRHQSREDTGGLSKPLSCSLSSSYGLREWEMKRELKIFIHSNRPPGLEELLRERSPNSQSVDRCKCSQRLGTKGRAEGASLQPHFLSLSSHDVSKNPAEAVFLFAWCLPRIDMQRAPNFHTS